MTRMVRDFMLHGSNLVLVATALAAGIAEATGAVRLSPWLVAAGAALFYLSEYGTHRFLFHAAPSRFATIRALQHRLHYDHHKEPTRLDLLFLPLW